MKVGGTPWGVRETEMKRENRCMERGRKTQETREERDRNVVGGKERRDEGYVHI